MRSYCAQSRNVGREVNELLEISQVTADLNYAIRVVLGRGITIDDDILRLSRGNSAASTNRQKQ
jgi:hypothetical protein